MPSAACPGRSGRPGERRPRWRPGTWSGPATSSAGGGRSSPGRVSRGPRRAPADDRSLVLAWFLGPRGATAEQMTMRAWSAASDPAATGRADRPRRAARTVVVAAPERPDPRCRPARRSTPRDRHAGTRASCPRATAWRVVAGAASAGRLTARGTGSLRGGAERHLPPGQRRRSRARARSPRGHLWTAARRTPPPAAGDAAAATVSRTCSVLGEPVGATGRSRRRSSGPATCPAPNGEPRAADRRSPCRCRPAPSTSAESVGSHGPRAAGRARGAAPSSAPPDPVERAGRGAALRSRARRYAAIDSSAPRRRRPTRRRRRHGCWTHRAGRSRELPLADGVAVVSRCPDDLATVEVLDASGDTLDGARSRMGIADLSGD